MNPSPQLQAIQQPIHPDQTDEISLVDLARVIWRHRRVAMLTLLTVIVLGLAGAFLAPRKYAYSTTIEIGTRIESERMVPIETADTALAKVLESYIPQQRDRYLSAHPDSRDTFDVTARVPRGSQLIVLESKATAQNADALQQIQGQVVQALVADHARIFEDHRRATELSKQRAERDLEVLAGKEAILRGRIERLQQTAQLLGQQIADTGTLIEDATKNRARAVTEARDEARAMTLLMLDNEVRENRAHLAKLQKQLQIGLADQRDRLQNELQSNRRDHALQRAEVQRLDQALSNLQETRAVILGLKSPRPVGPGRGTILMLSVLLGGLLAMLMPLLVEFGAQVRNGLGADDTGRAAAANEPATVGE